MQPILCKDNIIIGKMQIDVGIFLSGSFLLQNFMINLFLLIFVKFL